MNLQTQLFLKIKISQVNARQFHQIFQKIFQKLYLLVHLEMNSDWYQRCGATAIMIVLVTGISMWSSVLIDVCR